MNHNAVVAHVLILRIIFIGAGILAFLFSGWLFFFAPCSTVKEYWMLTHTPARCITP